MSIEEQVALLREALVILIGQFDDPAAWHPARVSRLMAIGKALKEIPPETFNGG